MKTLEKNGNVMVILEEEDHKRCEGYWTAERFKSAKPIGILESPDGRSKEVALDPIEPSLADTKAEPFKYGGKLFGHKPKEGDYAGSIQFCGNARIAMTAAHCVKDGSTGTWYENIAFRLKYPDETNFKIMAMGVKEKWKNNDYRYDYAIVILDHAGEGYLEFSLESNENDALSMGYPSNYHDGNSMMQVTTPVKLTADKRRAEMQGNPFSFGASGGAWIRNSKIIGVNSTKYENTPIVTSPVFDDDFQSLYDFMLEHL